ncbi:hypothetical protein JCM16303_004142 [Sporobolomyces ruberrimus]
MADIWIKADYPLGPLAQQPIEQAVADVLAKAPWAAWQTGEVPFRYEYIDRPEAGTALLAILSPPQRPAPNDGLRYLIPDSVERRTVTQHTVACPVSASTPTQNQSFQIELECYTSYQGHFPPTSRDQILPPNSPELRLTRFRKRWRIVNGQYPTLWFFWWGRDEFGGAGVGPSRTAPVGWDRTPVRVYPIVRDPNMPTAALYPFPGPSRGPPGASSSSSTGGGGGPPTASAGEPVPNPIVRAEQLAASAQQAQPGGIDPRQAYFAQQQHQHLRMQQQREAQARGLAGTASGVNPQLAYNNMTPAQLQQAQLLAQQRFAAQQQAAYANAQARPPLQTAPPNQTQTPASRKANLPSTTPSGPPAKTPAPVPPPSLGPLARESILDSPTPTVDVLDVLTSRQLAMHRLSIAQENLAPIFDPWTTSSILAGYKRKREVEEAVRTEAADPRTGESRGGIAGFGREHTLTILGTSAARISVHAAMGKDVNKATFSLEERKEKLSAMLERIKKETEGMEEQHARVVAQVEAKSV